MILKIDWKKLITSLALCLGIGGLVALLTRESMEIYAQLKAPPLAPPSWVFPVVWTVLYILMGISLYLVRVTRTYGDKRAAYAAFAVQLLLNFLWPLIFFNMGRYLLAFAVLVLMWIAVIVMIILFKRISRAAAYLNIPYILWLTFAGYLNIAVYMLNK